MAVALGSGTERLGAPAAAVPGAAAEAGRTPPPPPPPRLPLAPEEVTRRLQSTRRELSNRRKLLLRNLPAESSSQEIHDLLKDFELKYCYVDKNKRTAFVTLLNGEQAQNAIRLFHHYSLRGKEISVQLQPTDALLCITNLPTEYTLQEFEELVRPYGNVERHFLIYSEITGYSKGYGFVEYMKKDSAAKARLDLLGKPLGGNVLFAQWMDVNQLTPELIHSRCLCVENLPKDYTNVEDLLQTFSSKYKPVFYQLAQEEDSSVGGFAVIEYETAEQAEEVQQSTDGLIIEGNSVHVTYAAPGAPGRGTLATLIAAQRMMRNNRKGLLPEPNAIQIMKSFNTPSMLQMLLQPKLHGCVNKLPILGAPVCGSSLVSPSVSPAFLHFSNVHQRQSLLGEPPAVQLQTMLGIGTVPLVATDIGSHREAHNLSNQAQTPVGTGIGVLPFFPNQYATAQAIPRQNSTQDQALSAVGMTEGAGSGTQAYLQNLTNVSAGGLQAGHGKPSQSKNSDSKLGSSSKNQTSLLGEPPKEIHLSTNPYLNLASVLPSVCLSAIANKASNPKQPSGLPNSTLDTAPTPAAALQTIENYYNYSPQYGDYTQESDGGIYGDYSTYLQVLPSYYAAAQGSFHPGIVPFTPPGPLKTAPVRNEKRGSSYLITTSDDSPAEYVGQQTQGSGVHYAELYLKRKRVY